MLDQLLEEWWNELFAGRHAAEALRFSALRGSLAYREESIYQSSQLSH